MRFLSGLPERCGSAGPASLRTGPGTAITVTPRWSAACTVWNEPPLARDSTTTTTSAKAPRIRLRAGKRQGSGRAPSVREIVTKITDLGGRPDLIQWGAYPQKPTDPMLIRADNTRLRSTGWSPRYDLDQGLRQTFNDASLGPVFGAGPDLYVNGTLDGAISWQLGYGNPGECHSDDSTHMRTDEHSRADVGRHYKVECCRPQIKRKCVDAPPTARNPLPRGLDPGLRRWSCRCRRANRRSRCANPAPASSTRQTSRPNLHPDVSEHTTPAGDGRTAG